MEQSKFAVKNSDLNRDVALLERGERASVTAGGASQPTSLDLQRKITPLSAEQMLRPQKDNWDKIAALAPILSAALIFLTGSYCTYTYNQQQIKIQQCQTIEKFIPHLMGNEQTKKAAILALSTLINTETAGKFASIFASTGTVSALQSLSQNGTEKDKLIATQALSSALQNLADRESKLSTIEQDYKHAIAEKAHQSSDNPDTPYNLNKLAQLYIIRGQYALAEPLLKRSLEIRERVYGADHPEVVDALKSLAELYQLSGKSELAETTLKHAREIEEKRGYSQITQNAQSSPNSSNFSFGSNSTSSNSNSQNSQNKFSGPLSEVPIKGQAAEPSMKAELEKLSGQSIEGHAADLSGDANHQETKL